MKTIEIIVTAEGKTSVRTVGFSGPACREASRLIELALGQRTAEQLTAEFHQTGAVQQTQQHRA